MTPAPPPGQSGSSPSSPRPGVKQQRAEQRAAKLEQYHQDQKRSIRNRRIALIGGVTAAVAVVGLVVASVVLTPREGSYSAGGKGAAIEGVQTFTNTAAHVRTEVDYPQTPPAGGEHNPAWLNCGVYTQQVPSENAVHSQEHGALWITYDPAIDDADLATLRSLLPSTYVVLSPFDGLPAPIVLSGWNSQLAVDSVDDKRIAAYIEEYWQSNTVPEPGSPCTGGIDGPGKA